MKMFCMLLVVGIVCCYTSQIVDATEGPEVFDIKKGEIVLTLPNSNSLQNQVKNWLSSSVSGIAGALRIEPSDGIAIKVPLTPPYIVQNKWITGTVTEVVIFVGKIQAYNPTMLVFTKENNFVAVYIKGDTLKTFLKENNLYNSELYLGDTPLH